VNRVTVFERPDAASLFVEWWDDLGRNRESLKTTTGHPITDKELAKKIAHRMADAQERKRNQQAAEALGLGHDRTLPELLERLHADRSSDWSDSYVRDQDRYRKFWQRKLGGVRLSRVTAATVERIAATEARAKDWSPRTQGAVLRYIVDAYYYAERKLKWIGPGDNLSAVEIPKPRSKSRAYSRDEARTLLPALEEQDPRAAWIGWVAVLTGRRLTAIRTLPKDAVRVEEDRAVLSFPSDTDKARSSGEAVIWGERPLSLLRHLMDAPGRYVCGVKAPSHHTCRIWLEDAEEAAGVPHMKGRLWHGFKRLYATMAKGHPGRERQSGTTGQTLDRVYVQDELAPKADLAKKLAGEMEEV